MTKPISISLASAGVLLFAVGVLVGQQAHHLKFEKYLRPTPVTYMQLALLETNMAIISDRVPQEDIAVPKIHYAPSCNCFYASVWVSSELMKRPLNEVRQTLMVSAVTARSSLEFAIPEIQEFKADSPDPDFKMQFWQFKGTSKVVVAEWADGKLLFK
jgi:hypothetical protein